MRPTPSRRLALPLVTLALAACSEESPKNRRSDREREPGAEVAKSASSSEPKASSSSAAPAAPPSSATAAASATAAPSASAASRAGDAPPAMVRIEAGRFKMGSDDGEPDEKPIHEVEVAAFDLDRTEVTVADYRRCVAAKACTEPGTGNRSSGR